MTLLEDFPDFNLWHDASCFCLYATWRGKHSSAQTREQYNLIREHLLSTRSTKLLNDGLQDEDGWHTAACWLADEGLRRLAEDGMQIIAWVLPQHPGAFFDTAQVLARAQQPLVDTFTDAQAAYDWLHRWPLGLPANETSVVSMTAAKFLLLSPTQQNELVKQHGRSLIPRWEPDYYVKPYHLFNTLLVEVYYYVHSGVFHQIKAQVLPRE